MTQLSFSDAEHADKRKQTRREAFLGEMEQVVPWKALLAQVEPRTRRPVGADAPTLWKPCCASTCCSSGTR